MNATEKYIVPEEQQLKTSLGPLLNWSACSFIAMNNNIYKKKFNSLFFSYDSLVFWLTSYLFGEMHFTALASVISLVFFLFSMQHFEIFVFKSYVGP